MTTPASSVVAEAVCEAILTVLRDTAREPKSIGESSLLSADLGLDSLDLAQTIVLLERSLGVDPFRTPAVSRPSLRTVSDLVSTYHHALQKP